VAGLQSVAGYITAPEELGLDTRVEFREGVIRELDRLPEGASVTIDLARTLRVDSAGLSTLMLVQRHAETRRQRVILLHPSDELRFLLALTQMNDLFEVEPRRQ
jgi:anti-anti-sigma factor